MHRRSIQHVLILVSLSACANNEGGASALGSPAAAGAAGAAGITANAGAQGTAGAAGVVMGDGASFETSVQPFINMNCGCHQSNPLMAPFSLKKGEAYNAIVNVPSSQLKTMLLVKPGSTDESYLWHKVNGTFMDVGGIGMIMPSNIPLNETEKKIFERWILAGAKP